MSAPNEEAATAELKAYELALLAEFESGLAKLRASLPPHYIPGMLMAEEFCRKMRERQP